MLNNLRSEKPRWKEWLTFFITGSINQADYYIEKLKKIESLHVQLTAYAEKNGVRQDLIAYIFTKPVFTIKDVQNTLGISYNTARNHVNKLMESEKIYADDKKRNKMYRFYELMDIVRS